MKVEKSLTIALGGYESLRIGVVDCDSYLQCDVVLIAELRRLTLPVSERIRKALCWDDDLTAWMGNDGK